MINQLATASTGTAAFQAQAEAANKEAAKLMEDNELLKKVRRRPSRWVQGPEPVTRKCLSSTRADVIECVLDSDGGKRRRGHGRRDGAAERRSGQTERASEGLRRWFVSLPTQTWSRPMLNVTPTRVRFPSALKRSQSEAEARKQQVDGLSREYDRLLTDHRQLQVMLL